MKSRQKCQENQKQNLQWKKFRQDFKLYYHCLKKSLLRRENFHKKTLYLLLIYFNFGCVVFGLKFNQDLIKFTTSFDWLIYVAPLTPRFTWDRSIQDKTDKKRNKILRCCLTFVWFTTFKFTGKNGSISKCDSECK